LKAATAHHRSRTQQHPRIVKQNQLSFTEYHNWADHLIGETARCALHHALAGGMPGLFRRLRVAAGGFSTTENAEPKI
jgi:hypothetical protein